MGLADAPVNMAYGGCLIKARIMQAVFFKISISGQKKTPPVKAGLFVIVGDVSHIAFFFACAFPSRRRKANGQ